MKPPRSILADVLSLFPPEVVATRIRGVWKIRARRPLAPPQKPGGRR